MPIPHKRTHLPIRRIVLFAALAAVAIVGSVLVWRHFHPVASTATQDQGTSTQTKQIDYQPPTTDQKANGATIKENAASTPTTQPDQSIDVLITSSAVSSNTLHIRTSIGTDSSSGKCTLTLVNGSKTITRESGIQAMASSSTCMGFDIPTSDLGAGTWKITVTYSNGSTSGSASMEKTL